MATTITVIWNDRNCDGDSYPHVQEISLELTPGEIREYSTSTLVRAAMLAYYKAGDDPGLAIALTNEAIKSYGFVGIINGAVDWLH